MRVPNVSSRSDSIAVSPRGDRGARLARGASSAAVSYPLGEASAAGVAPRCLRTVAESGPAFHAGFCAVAGRSPAIVFRTVAAVARTILCATGPGCQSRHKLWRHWTRKAGDMTRTATRTRPASGPAPQRRSKQAADLATPLYRPRTIPDKRRQAARRWCRQDTKPRT